MFSHRRQRRRCAFMVLLLLLFGLGAGAVNACLVTSRAAATHVQAHVHEPDDGPASAGHAHPDRAWTGSAAPDPQAPLASAHCQDFCAKATLSLWPMKSAADEVQAAALIATVAAVVRPVPAFRAAPPWPPRRHVTSAPRIHIAFLRLAL